LSSRARTTALREFELYGLCDLGDLDALWGRSRAFEHLELGALARQRRDQLLDLDVLRERDPAQVLDVLLSLELAGVHALY
jgi:hypothetical protein